MHGKCFCVDQAILPISAIIGIDTSQSYDPAHGAKGDVTSQQQLCG